MELETITNDSMSEFYARLERLNEAFIREMGMPGILEVKVTKRLFEVLVDTMGGMLAYSTKGDAEITYNWLDLNFPHGTIRIFPEDSK